ncbi:MAG TPA: hypothetical protein VH619_10865 [Verrucomicrobiae bacterium]|nr:hypothetical protein [Verrucomicrobiae bacterium]
MTKLTITNSSKSWGKPILVAVTLLSLCIEAAAQTYALAPLWYDTTNSPVGTHITTGDVNRGMAYYAASNIVFVVNKGITGSGTTPAIDALDGTTGAYLGSANVTGVVTGSSGGNFSLNYIGVANDGVLYGANLSTTPAYKIYQWTNWTTAPTIVYSGDPTGGLTTGKRVGDSIAITGSGVNTMILAAVVSGTTPTTNMVLFSTVDGVNFTPTLLDISGMAAPSGNDGPEPGYTFFTNNTFLYNPENSSTYLVQFPANFASLTSPVTATNLLTTTFGGNPVFLSYNPTAGLLATMGPVPNSTSATAKTAVSLYEVPPFSDLASALATTNFVTTNANGNFVGGVALGGVGGTNVIYALDCNNGIQAESILFTAGAIPPSISSQPVGGAFFSTLPSFTLAVAAGGTAPLYYQWQFNSVSNVATATNILAATNNTYTITNPTASVSGWYDVIVTNAGGVTNSIPVQVTVLSPTTNSAFSNLWSLSPSSRPYLDPAGNYDTRGLAFDTNTMTLLVCDKGADLGIFVLNATNGNDLFAMNTIGIGVTGDQFSLDQVGVADDGIVYACNLYDTGSTADTFAIFSWSSVSSNAVPQFAYGPSDPSAPGIQDRWGDTMAVRGAGANTEILLGSYNGFLNGPATNAALLTTTATDGTGFNALPLIITNASGIPAGFSSLGICFGAGNTFWAKSPGDDLYEIAFDPVSGNCNILLDLPSGTSGNSSFNSMSSICLDSIHNILTGITFNDVPNDLSVYQLYGTPSAPLPVPPYLSDQAFFPSNIGNSQANGVTIIKAPYIFGLDVNNGLAALTYGALTAPPFPGFPATASAVTTGKGVTITWQSYSNVSYQVEYSTLLTSNTAWTDLGSSILATNISTSYTDTNPPDVARYYRVVLP